MAKKIDIENDLNIVLHNEVTQLNLSKLHNSNRFDVAMCFGCRPSELGLQTSLKANRFYTTETFDVLLSFSLAQLRDNKQYKTSLWNALKDYKF